MSRQPWVRAGVKTAKKKAILVDGASFYNKNQRQQLNLGSVIWPRLVKELQAIGTGIPQAPVYTIWPSTPDYMMKIMSAAGLTLEPIHSTGGQDDQYLISQIDALDPQEFESLVLVTFDADFIRPARDAQKKGIKVYWVAADIRSLGRQTKEIAQEEFNFVDLNDGILDRIRRAPWHAKTKSEPERNPEVESEGVKILFEAVISTQELPSLMTLLQPVIEKFKIKLTTST